MSYKNYRYSLSQCIFMHSVLGALCETPSTHRLIPSGAHYISQG